MMVRVLRPCFVALLGLAVALAGYENCCERKTVGEKSYSLVKSGGTVPRECINSCVYALDEDPSQNVCFAPGNETATCRGDSCKEPQTQPCGYAPRVIYEDTHSPPIFPASNALTQSNPEYQIGLDNDAYFLSNYWLGNPDGKFVLDFGCERSFNLIQLVNTHNGVGRDRSTNEFLVKVSKSYPIDTELQPVYTGSLQDSRNQQDPLTLQQFPINSTVGRYVQFEILTHYGLGGGLDFFNILNQKIKIKGMIIAGGSPSDSAGNSVEMYLPSTGQHCQLPNFPGDPRSRFTIDERTACGGVNSSGPITWFSDTEVTCLTLKNENWEQTTLLLEPRIHHCSWASPSGLIIMGGYRSAETTEKIQEDGTSRFDFPLKYRTAEACAINLGSTVIITGGQYSNTRVSEYDEAGWVRYLPNLPAPGKQFHGCSYYQNDDGTKTLLVTGGAISANTQSTTELLMETASAWVPAGELPSPLRGIKGANINNKILMAGGMDGTPPVYHDEILEFDPLTKEWKNRGKMMKARAAHAVSVINFGPGLCV